MDLVTAQFVRWWSECASSWREKWTQERMEKNKNAEEARDMRIKVESLEKTMVGMRWAWIVSRMN